MKTGPPKPSSAASSGASSAARARRSTTGAWSPGTRRRRRAAASAITSSSAGIPKRPSNAVSAQLRQPLPRAQGAQLREREVLGEPALLRAAVDLLDGAAAGELRPGRHVRGPGDLVLVAGDEPPVARGDHVGLDEVGAELDRELVGRQRVLGPVRGRAAVGDDDRAVHGRSQHQNRRSPAVTGRGPPGGKLRRDADEHRHRRGHQGGGAGDPALRVPRARGRPRADALAQRARAARRAGAARGPDRPPGGALRDGVGRADARGRPLRGRVRPQAARQARRRACPEWRFIHTHFGFGYRFQPERSHLFTRRPQVGNRSAARRASLARDMQEKEEGR